MPVRVFNRNALSWELLTREEISAGRHHNGLLYRFYDADRKPLYIGVTGSGSIRWTQHRKTAAWWSLAEYVAISHYDRYNGAEEAERAAIRRERPRFNKVGMTPRTRMVARLDGGPVGVAAELHRVADPEFIAELAALLASPDKFPQPEAPPAAWPLEGR